MKRRTIWIIVATVFLCLFVVFSAPALFKFPVIGTVFGLENEFIEINGVIYGRTTFGPYTSLDRERYIGSVKNTAITMRIYEFKGEDGRKYLHAVWDWEGYTYVRQSE